MKLCTNLQNLCPGDDMMHPLHKCLLFYTFNKNCIIKSGDKDYCGYEQSFKWICMLIHGDIYCIVCNVIWDLKIQICYFERGNGNSTNFKIGSLSLRLTQKVTLNCVRIVNYNGCEEKKSYFVQCWCNCYIYSNTSNNQLMSRFRDFFLGYFQILCILGIY